MKKSFQKFISIFSKPRGQQDLSDRLRGKNVTIGFMEKAIEMDEKKEKKKLNEMLKKVPITEQESELKVGDATKKSITSLESASDFPLKREKILDYKPQKGLQAASNLSGKRHVTEKSKLNQDKEPKEKSGLFDKDEKRRFKIPKKVLILVFSHTFVFLVGIFLFVDIPFFEMNGSSASTETEDIYVVYKNLINSLQGKSDLTEAHTAVYKFIKHENIGTASPTTTKFLKQIKSQTVPNDYKFFFQEVLQKYKQPLSQLPTPINKDKNLLVDFRSSQNYTTSFLFLLENTDRPQNLFKERLEITGTYTSPYDYPTGLFIQEGKIINPIMQSWDGLLVVDRNGRLNLMNLNEFQYGFRTYKIKERQEDYLDFLKFASDDKISVMQSHLILNNGEIDVSNNKRLFKRRAVVSDKSGEIFVYDSLNKSISLFDLATILKEKYDALYAINLDMGAFNYCSFIKNGIQTKDCGDLSKDTRLSNIIVFDYN